MSELIGFFRLLDKWDRIGKRKKSKGIRAAIRRKTIRKTQKQQGKLGSKLGQISAENRIKPWSVTQSQAKRINEIALLWLFRDQGVGGSNPLSPTNLHFSHVQRSDRTAFCM